jgi:hypothetical protein
VTYSPWADHTPLPYVRVNRSCGTFSFQRLDSHVPSGRLNSSQMVEIQRKVGTIILLSLQRLHSTPSAERGSGHSLLLCPACLQFRHENLS